MYAPKLPPMNAAHYREGRGGRAAEQETLESLHRRRWPNDTRRRCHRVDNHPAM
jgi:hypothetical protein